MHTVTSGTRNSSGRRPRLSMKRALATAATTVAATLAVAAPAAAETISGTFSYSDYYPFGTSYAIGSRPIVGADVEVNRYAPNFLGIWIWSRVATARTDESGSFSVYVSHRAKGAKYRVRIHATNDAASTGYSIEPGITHTAWAFTDVLDFRPSSFTGAAADHFNVVETLRHARAYAFQNRDPRETDQIPRVRVDVGGASSSGWYDPSADTIRITHAGARADHHLLHEYAHFLQEQISSFAWIPSNHEDGCIPTDAWGNPINSSEHAWMEGFADYFAQVVATLAPGGHFYGGGTFSAEKLENQPSQCGVSGGSGVELWVAGSLWDVFDAPGDPFFAEESHDTLHRYDRVVFEIVDRELDVYGTWPTMYAFREAWWGRGLSSRALDLIVGHHGIAGPFLPTPSPAPPPPAPGEEPPDTIDPCDAKPWLCEDTP